MKKTSIPIDIFSFPFNKNTLIEASAGTGKTFTIIILYLLLLLGIGSNNNFSKPLSVREILIVTFTKTATEELKRRIKQYIYKLKIACINNTTKTDSLKKIIKKITNFKKSIYLLEKAEYEIDLIEIYTIHGFCKKILKNYCYQYQFLNQYQPIENDYYIYLRATRIFWKKYCHLLSYDISKLIYQYWTNEEKFLQNIYPLLKIKSLKIQTFFKKKQNIKTYHRILILKITKFKKIWLKNKKRITIYINDIIINRSIYNINNTNRWINIITTWSKTNTIDYVIPKEMYYFSYIKIKSQIKNNIKKIPYIFKIIQKLLKTNFSIKEIIIFNALKIIPSILEKEKEKNLLYEFHDLITMLNNSLKNKKIIKIIKKKYPIVFIDEFQDTDAEQYKIFKTIYTDSNQSGLIVIGDPKQAIYNFRGADIFTYMQAKSEIKSHYYLTTNFRSSSHMVNSLNILFSKIKNPFIFHNIPFTSILSNNANQNIYFKKNELLIPALQFIVEPIKQVNPNNNWIADQCAINISNWINISPDHKFTIMINNKTRLVKKEDIVVLVRNKNEAKVIQTALEKININSIYLSEKKSIYNSKEAYEILWILKSIINLNNEKNFLTALSTNIMNNCIQKINKINTNYEYRLKWINIFTQYIEKWDKYGIYIMFKEIIKDQQFIFSNQNLIQNEYTINNILHLGELLQEQEQILQNKYNLIQWLQEKIQNKQQNISKKEIIQHKNKNSIRIINIHTSKGLEFFIVCIPFTTNYTISKNPVFHKKNNQVILDLKNNDNSFKKSEQERLAEDIRLLYVALTRAIVHCYVGISTSKIKIKKKNNLTNLHHTALGYILQSGKQLNIEQFYNIIYKLETKKIIKITEEEEHLNQSHTINATNNNHIQIKYKKININKKIEITNYTKLNHENKIINNNTKNQINIQLNTKKILNNITNNPHNFITGKLAGIILHNLLRKIDFSKKIEPIIIKKEIEKYNLCTQLLSMLSNWIYDIYHTKLFKNKNFSLSNLKKNEYIKELEFFLPIKTILNSIKLNSITIKSDPLSKILPKIQFYNKQGMINGFIDLVFSWNKKYYILDYKSNWLGENNEYYNLFYIKNEIIKNRYDLQYQIYSVALHRYLKNKIKNYKCETHFGGIFYFFIRSADGNNKNNGIFYQPQPIKLIQQLDKII
ncbi:RecBCD enzyme subunit RecB [Buchnera aphidicola (Eriosoma lanigerum)]|uniref:exodeoxyribonuclease V subunit beta n=1 Tax=Buchnera aphidicola TaxID=9 RepID=UPI003463AAAF